MVNQPPAWNRMTPTVPEYGLVVQPAAGGTIVDSGALPAGLYRVEVLTSYGGVADVIDNMALFRADAKITTLTVVPVGNGAVSSLVLTALAVYEGQHLTVRAIAGGALNSVYRAVITATPIQTQDIT